MSLSVWHSPDYLIILFLMSKRRSLQSHQAPLQSIDETPEKLPDHLTIKEKKKLDRMFQDSEVQEYFLKAQGSTPFQTIELAAHLYSDSGISKVTDQIRVGQLKLSAEPARIDNLLMKQKIHHQEQKALELRLKKEQIDQKLAYFTNQVSLKDKRAESNLSPCFDFCPPNVLSKQQHSMFVTKMAQQRQLMDQRHRQHVEKLEKSIAEEQQKLSKLKEKKMDRAREKRKEQIKKSLERKKAEHEKIIAFEIESRKKFQQVKKKQFLHQRIESKYQNEVVLPSLQQKKKRLREIRELSKAFNVEDIRNHEKQYTEKRNQSFSVARSRVNSDDWNYKPPEKTQRLSRILEQQKIQQRKNLEERKRAIEEKITRQDNFVAYLKEKFSPKVDEAKQKQIHDRIQSKSQRRESLTDGKVLGMSYLQQVKRMKKKSLTIQRPETEKLSQKSDEKMDVLTRRGATDYLVVNRKDRMFYEAKRRKRLDEVLKSGDSEAQKLKKLKRQNEKISEQFERKNELMRLGKHNVQSEEEALELLLSGIKAKMGMIEIFKGGKQTI